MQPLESIQNEMRAAIIGGHLGAAARIIAGDGLHPERRLAICRHNFVHTLIEALGATYPVTRRLLGDRAFAAAGQWFISLSPPTGPCLFEYGEDFPAFLAAHPAVGALAYIGDVARFEWAVNRAYHAPNGEPPPPPAGLPDRAGELVAVAASHVAVIESPYPVEAIWEANQQDEVPWVDLKRGGDRLVVFRRGLDVLWRALGPEEAVLLTALCAGRPLAVAFELSCKAETGFDPASAVASFAAEGLILGFLPPTVSERVSS
jgi:hypothetical protein